MRDRLLVKLWEQVSGLQRIRGDKKEIKQVLSETLQLQKPEPSTAAEGQAESPCIRLESGNFHDGEGWKLVPSGPKGKASAPCADLQLWNRFSAVAAPWLRALSSEALEPAEPEPCGKKWWVIVLGDSALVRNANPHLLTWLAEVCCLLGAQERDVVEGLFQSSDYYSLLLFHLNTSIL